MNYQKELNTAIEAITQASNAALSIYSDPVLDFSIKTSDDSPLTQADIQSNDIICQHIRANFSDPILSEENKDDLKRLAASRLWLVDPLDGTKEFLSRNGEFTINIALIENKRPVMGVIAYPVKNYIFSAIRGQGAFLHHNDQITPVSVANKQELSHLKIAVSRSHLNPTLAESLSKLENCELVQRGSALKYCAVADGSIDATIRKTPLCEWDIAAADCILHEAGGIITSFAGELFNYNNEDTVIRSGIVASNRELHQPLLTLIQ